MNILRVTNIAKRLHIPLVWLVQCSGVKMTDQEKFYADRRGPRCYLTSTSSAPFGLVIFSLPEDLGGGKRSCCHPEY